MSLSTRCVLYARKSTDREDKQILSIPAQLSELRSFAIREGLAITEEIIEHCSAREPGRPIFSKLLHDVAAGRVERIVSWKLDRLARNPIDGGALIHYLGKGLLKELVTPEGRYTGAGDSKFMLSVLFGAATKMTDDLSVGVTRGNKAIHERGRITGIAPLGYMKIRDRNGYRGAGKVVPDPERFAAVRKMWVAVLQGETVRGIWRKATGSWGLTMRETANRGARLPCADSIYRILQNRFYAGQIVRRGEVFQGEHEPMVTLAEFEQVQRMVHRDNAPRPVRQSFLYCGLLHCADCSRLLTGELIKGQYIYYRCGRRRYGRVRCASPAPGESQVTNDIERSLATIALPPKLIDWTMETIDVWIAGQTNSRTMETRGHELELAQVERQLGRLTDLVVAGTIKEDDYVERRSKALERQVILRRMINEPQEAEHAWRDAMREALSATAGFQDGFRNGTKDERRELLRQVYENFLVHDRITAPVLRFPYSAFAESTPVPAMAGGGDENYPSPTSVLLYERKNARPRNDRERAFRAWWNKIVGARTKMEHSKQRDHTRWTGTKA